MKKKKFNIYLVSAVILMLLGCIIYLRFDYFSIHSIQGEIQENTSWDVPLSAEKQEAIEKIFSQNFYYYARGRQNFVFISEDKKYVLKFINHDRFRYPSFFYKIFMPPFFDKIRQSKIEKKKRRPDVYFSGYKIAYDRMKEKTGLVYIHLNPTRCFNRKLRIFTKSNKSFAIDIDQTRFLLQKKGQKLFPYFDSQYKKHKEEGLQKAIDQLLLTIKERCLHNIVDDDLNIGNNAGFYQEQVIFFDLGKWYADDNLQIKQEMLKSTKFFRRWLSSKYPQVLPYFDQRLQAIIDGT